MCNKYGFVYLWYDRLHGMFYIGSHWGTVDDGYICSSNRMREAYRRRQADFKRRIIAKVQERSDLLKEEQRWLSMINPISLRTRYYNVNLDVLNPWWNDKDMKTTIGERISKAKKGKSTGRCSPEKAKRISEAKKAAAARRLAETGNALTPAQQKAMLNNKHSLGRKHSEEWKLDNSERMKRIWADPNYKNPGNFGKSQPESQRIAVSKALKGRRKNKKRADNALSVV